MKTAAKHLRPGMRVFLPADPKEGLEEVRGVVREPLEDGFYYVWIDPPVDDITEVPAEPDDVVEVLP